MCLHDPQGLTGRKKAFCGETRFVSGAGKSSPVIYGVRIRGQKKDISREEGCPLQEEKSCSQKVSKEEGGNEESRPKEGCSQKVSKEEGSNEESRPKEGCFANGQQE